MILKVGTPLWQSSSPDDTGKPTAAVLPANSTEAHSVLAGVTVRENEDSRNVDMKVQRSGLALVRVSGEHGAVKPGDTLAQMPGQDYLVKNTATPPGPVAGVANGVVADGSAVKLIWVRLGAGGSGGGDGDSRWQ